MTDFAPDTLKFTSFEVVASHTASMVESPYSNAQTVYDFGGDRWTVTPQLISYNSLPGRAVQADLEGWLLSLNGPVTPFLLKHFDHDGPFGVTNGDPVSTDDNAARKSSIVITHTLPVELPRPALLRGDWFEAGDHLHRVTKVGLTDASGEQTIAFWPPLRAALTAGDALNITDPHGIWRLTADPVKWVHDWAAGREVTISMVEALG